MWRLRGAVAVILCLLYVAIGRDLIAVARAKTDTAKMEVSSEVHQLTADIENVADGAGLATVDDESVAALTSAGALPEGDAWSD